MIQQILAQYPLPPIHTKTQLVRHLQFCHALMVATDELLRLAGMEEKQREERGHADWLAEDLANLGIATTPYDYAAATIAGAQYYFIKHLDPRVLLGYCAVLECRTFTSVQVDAMEAVLGGVLPCVRFHAEHDLQHGNDVLEQIEQLDNSTLKAWIFRNAADTAAALSAITTIRLAEEHQHGRPTEPLSDRHEPTATYRDGALYAAWDDAPEHRHYGRA